jgi:hypothetical protein
MVFLPDLLIHTILFIQPHSARQQRGHSMERRMLIHFTRSLLMYQNYESKDKFKQKEMCYCNILIFCKEYEKSLKSSSVANILP